MLTSILGTLPWVKWFMGGAIVLLAGSYLFPAAGAFLKPVFEALGKLGGWLIDTLQEGGKYVLKSAPALILIAFLSFVAYNVGLVRGITKYKEQVISDLHKDYKFIPKKKGK